MEQNCEQTKESVMELSLCVRPHRKIFSNFSLPSASGFSFLESKEIAVGREMNKLVFLSLLFALFGLLHLHAAATSPTLQTQQLQPKSSLQAQPKRNCPYTVIIKTSCSSTTYTRDQISLAYGDAHGNEVYAKRLDNPVSRTFESCSSDEFHINGPCARNICYLNLLRNGSDSWKPEFVKIYGPYTNTVTFSFNTFLPNRVWFGHNLCHGVSAP